MKIPDYYFTVTETYRITGRPKMTIYNKRDSGEISIVGKIRSGRGKRRCTERVISFSDLVKLLPANDLMRGDQYVCSNIENKMKMLFMLDRTVPEFAFTITDTVRLTGLSNSWLHNQIKGGKIGLITNLRKYRVFWERLILEDELLKLKPGLNIGECILNMFKLE